MNNSMPTLGTNLKSHGSTMGCQPQFHDGVVANKDVASWGVTGEAYFPVPTTTATLPTGFYSCDQSHGGPFFQKLGDTPVDDLMQLPDPTTDMLMKEFVTFWERASHFAERGLSAKRGLLLWGPPGSGKTSAVFMMAHHMIKTLGGVVVLVGEPHVTIELLRAFRRVEPTRPLICVWEDIDALIERFGEAEYLSLLDGERQISNVVNVATTNYPERLDRRFADRPGRFDRVQQVPMPLLEARLEFLRQRAPDLDPDTIQKWADASDGWSLAHLRELIVSAAIFGDDPDETIDRLNAMGRRPEGDMGDRGTQSIGFAA